MRWGDIICSVAFIDQWVICKSWFHMCSHWRKFTRSMSAVYGPIISAAPCNIKVSFNSMIFNNPSTITMAVIDTAITWNSHKYMTSCDDSFLTRRCAFGLTLLEFIFVFLFSRVRKSHFCIFCCLHHNHWYELYIFLCKNKTFYITHTFLTCL